MDSRFFFAKKDLLFIKNQPALQMHSQQFLAKTSSDFSQINPQSTFDYMPSQYILQKPPQIIVKSIHSLDRMGSGFFAKKTFSLSKINPRSRDTLSIF
jgi:hypothetical protein